MIGRICLAACLLTTVLRADEIEDLKRELAELKSDYTRRVESIEARLAQLSAAQAKGAAMNQQVMEMAVRTEVKAVETAQKLEEAQEQIRQNKEAIERFSSTPLYDKREPSDTAKLFEFHGYARSGYGINERGGPQVAFQVKGSSRQEHPRCPGGIHCRRNSGNGRPPTARPGPPKYWPE